MQVTRDLIVSVNGPGWNYGLARLLVDADGRASLWLPPGDAPVAEFNMDVNRTSAVAGSGMTDDGGAVSWRRRGSGCSWALAKCKVATATLAARWATPTPAPVASPGDDTAATPEPTSEATPAPETGTDTGTSEPPA